MKFFAKIAMTAALLVAAGSAFAHGYKVGDLEIGHPATRAMLGGQKVGGGFMKITNNGKEDDRFVSVTSAVSDDIQLHEMAVVNDVMQMRELKDGIPLPAGQTVELKKGGLHVMFMSVKTPFKEGDKIPAVLHFEKAGDVNVEFVVGPANGAGQTEMKHDMSNMNGQMPKK